jgi:hypothetical protein
MALLWSSPFWDVKIVVSLRGIRESEPIARVREENMSIKATMRSVLLIITAFALAMPAFAQTRDPTLNDPQQPGSAIVFSKFIKGTVMLPEGGMAPASALKVGVMCPNGATCSSDQEVKIRFHWVCGTTEANLAGSFVCRETDFDVTATVFEKIVLTPMASSLGCRLSSYPGPDVTEGI